MKLAIQFIMLWPTKCEGLIFHIPTAVFVMESPLPFYYTCSMYKRNADLSSVGGWCVLLHSTGYFSLTANFTSCVVSVRGRRSVKIVYSWSVSTIFPWWRKYEQKFTEICQNGVLIGYHVFLMKKYEQRFTEI